MEVAYKAHFADVEFTIHDGYSVYRKMLGGGGGGVGNGPLLQGLLRSREPCSNCDLFAITVVKLHITLNYMLATSLMCVCVHACVCECGLEQRKVSVVSLWQLLGRACEQTPARVVRAVFHLL